MSIFYIFTAALLQILIGPVIAIHELCQLHNSDHEWLPYSGYRLFTVYDASKVFPALNRWPNQLFPYIGSSVAGSAVLWLLMKVNADSHDTISSSMHPQLLIVKCRFGESEKWTTLPAKSTSGSRSFPIEACLAGLRFTTEAQTQTLPHDVVCIRLTMTSTTTTTAQEAATTPSFHFKTLALMELNSTATLPIPHALPLLKSGHWPFLHIGPETSHVPKLMIPILFTPGVLNRRYPNLRLNSQRLAAEQPPDPV